MLFTTAKRHVRPFPRHCLRWRPRRSRLAGAARNGELARQRCRHEVALALVETLLDEFLRAGQMHEEGGNVLGDASTVAALRGGAGDHGVLVQRLADHHPGVDDLEPRPAVIVCQPECHAHLVDNWPADGSRRPPRTRIRNVRG